LKNARQVIEVNGIRVHSWLEQEPRSADQRDYDPGFRYVHDRRRGREDQRLPV